MNIYIHIPFCKQKCTYCKFAITPVFDDYKKKKYLHFLENEIKNTLVQRNIKKVNTIYFGGGTPSILSADEIKKILGLFPEWEKEISFESNPEDISENFLEKIFSLWINRLSIGIQSLNPQTLEAVERSNPESIFSALESIKKFQVWKFILFWNKKISINLDFILGLPYTKKWEIFANIKYLHKKYPFITHTSVYFLEKWLYPKNWQKLSITEEEITKEYHKICNFFAQKWWNHYEISNFSAPWFECQHNQWYWNHVDTIGFWLSASGFEKISEWNFVAKRTTKSLSFSGYYKEKLSDEEYLTEDQIEIEKLLFGMRTHGYTINPKIRLVSEKKIQDFLEQKLLEWTPKKFRLTQKWIPIIDRIIDDIIL